MLNSKTWCTNTCEITTSIEKIKTKHLNKPSQIEGDKNKAKKGSIQSSASKVVKMPYKGLEKIKKILF